MEGSRTPEARGQGTEVREVEGAPRIWGLGQQASGDPGASTKAPAVHSHTAPGCLETDHVTLDNIIFNMIE